MSLKGLKEEVYGVFNTPRNISKEQADGFGRSLSDIVSERLARPNHEPRLRLSNLGTRCRRKLWYEINRPGLGDPLSPATRLKFLFGDIIEALVLFLAKVSGHEVTDEQKEVSLHGVVGHIDAKVDGIVVDVKSASSYSFKKFEDGLTAEEDAFGYLTQLAAYSQAEGQESGAFLVLDKTLGHFTVDEHSFKPISKEFVDGTKEMLAKSEPPPRSFQDEPEGASGNRRLGTVCSYCRFKSHCWPEIRQFNYSSKPVFLTVVNRLPRVPEVL